MISKQFLPPLSLLLIGLSICQFPICRSATGQLSTIVSSSDETTWFVHEDSGRIFAALKEQMVVVEYHPLSLEEVRRFDVGGSPEHMVNKDGVLVVTCEAPAKLAFIDLKDHKVSSMPVPAAALVGMFCSKAKNPYVYCIGRNLKSTGDEFLLQIDIAKGKVRNQSTPRMLQWDQTSPRNGTMSDDGKWLVVDARGASSPSGADLLKVDEDNFSFVHQFDHHSSFGQITSDAANRFWLLDNQLYSFDIKNMIRNFKGNVMALHPKLDLVVGYSTDEAYIQRFSDGKVLRTVKYSQKKETKKKKSRSTRFSKRENICLQYDLKNNQIVAAYRKTAHVISLDKLDLELEPRLSIVAPNIVETAYGNSIEIPISVFDPEMKGTKFELVDGPTGAQLSSNTITWTPTSEQIGESILEVQANYEGRKDTTEIAVNVIPSRVELDFIVKGIAANDAGTFAVAWGKKIVSHSRQGYRYENGNSDEIAVLDLENPRVVVQKTVPSGIKSAIVDEKYVYLIPKVASVLYRMEKSTLGNSKRQFVKGVPKSIFEFDKNVIGIVSVDNHSDREFLYQKESFKPLTDPKEPPHEFRIHSHMNRNSAFRKISPTLLSLPRRVIDTQTGEAIQIKDHGQIPLLQSFALAPNQANTMNPRFSSSPALHGRIIMGNGITSTNGLPVYQSSTPLFSSVYAPVAFGVTKSSVKGKKNSPTTQTVLETRNLFDGGLMFSTVVDVKKEPRSNSHFNEIKLLPRRDRVIVADKHHVTRVPLDPSAIEKAPVPLHFKPSKIPTLGVLKPGTIKLKTAGGNGDIKYSLVNDYQGVSIEESTGVLTVDTPTMWKSLLKSPPIPRDSGRQRKPPTAEQWYEKLTNSKLPDSSRVFALPFQVAATDEEGQVAQTSFSALVMAPRKILDARIAEQKAEREKRNIAIQAARTKKRNEQIRLQKEKQQKAAAENPNARIAELEKRITRLESTLDLVLEKLNKLNDSKDQ